MTIPAPPGPPAETLPPAESSITITVPPEKRSKPKAAQKPAPALPAVEVRAPDPVPRATTPPRRSHEAPRAEPRSASGSAGAASSQAEAEKARERAAKKRQAAAREAALERKAEARKRAAAQHKAAAAARARLAAGQNATDGAFFPPVAVVGDRIAATTTDIQPFPLAALTTLLAGVLLFLAAGMVPDRALVYVSRGTSHTLWLGAIASGLTFVLLGCVMLLSSF